MNNLEKRWNTTVGNMAKAFDLIEENIHTKRLLRLFAIACYDPIRNLITNETDVKAINIAELHADGQATDEELQNVFYENDDYHNNHCDNNSYECYIHSIWYGPISSVAHNDVYNAIYCVVRNAFHNEIERKFPGKILTNMLDHNFDNSWKNNNTIHIAKIIYKQKS